jgi:hypothetical protein
MRAKHKHVHDRVARCWHEAAHAVVASKFGLDVRSMEILDQHPRLGAETNYLPAVELAADASKLVRQGAAAADIVVAAAGRAIERRLGLADGSGDDDQTIWRMAYAFDDARNQRDTVNSVAQLRKLADELVGDHFETIKNWLPDYLFMAAWNVRRSNKSCGSKPMFSDEALRAFRNFCQVSGLHQRHPLGQDQEPVSFPAQRFNKDLGGQRVTDGGGKPRADQTMPSGGSTTGAGIPASASAGPSIGDQPNRPSGFHSTSDDQEQEPDDREADLRKFLAAQGMEPDAIDQACNLARGQQNGGATDEPPPFEGRPNVGAGPNKPAQGGWRNNGGQDAALAYGFSPMSNMMERRGVEGRKLTEALAAEGMAMDGSAQAKARTARNALSAHVNKTTSEFARDCPFVKVGFV